MQTYPPSFARSFLAFAAAVSLAGSFALATTPAAAATAASLPSSFTSTLSYGSSGAQVLKLQQMLFAEGFLKATPNGNFGPATKAAVKAFQGVHDIQQLGIVGPATRAALNAILTKSGGSASSAGSPSAGSTGQIEAGLPTLVPYAPSTLLSKGFSVSGWIPYWRSATGTADVLPHLSQISEVNPFGYTVKQDGTLYDAMGLDSSTWANFIASARAAHTLVIPTVMWSDTQSIHNVLSDPTLRAQHVASIVQAVTQNHFDGIDIDYEGKLAADKDNYSAFLIQLHNALKAANPNAVLDCTIEARTPPQDLNTTSNLADIEYANDYAVINQACDRVRLMTYDQEFVDKTLNQQHTNDLYAPIADPAWIKQVIALTTQSIPASKIELGVATYGYDYQVIPNSSGGGYSYDLIEAFNPAYALQQAQQFNITPSRNAAGELSFSYVPPSSVTALPSNSMLASLAPYGTPSSSLAAAGALALLSSQGRQAPFHLLWWSDATAIQQKVSLAKQLGLAGVAIFKFDGGEDPQMWNVLPSQAAHS